MKDNISMEKSKKEEVNVLRNERKTKEGIVVSNKMEKTIVVAIETMALHPIYKKRVKKTTKFKVHDEENVAQVGDKIRIMETRPLSKDKNWRLVEVIEKAR